MKVKRESLDHPKCPHCGVLNRNFEIKDKKILLVLSDTLALKFKDNICPYCDKKYSIKFEEVVLFKTEANVDLLCEHRDICGDNDCEKCSYRVRVI